MGHSHPLAVFLWHLKGVEADGTAVRFRNSPSPLIPYGPPALRNTLGTQIVRLQVRLIKSGSNPSDRWLESAIRQVKLPAPLPPFARQVRQVRPSRTKTKPHLRLINVSPR